MKKPTNLRLILFALIFLQSFFVVSQNLKAFAPPRFDKKLKGDMLLIGNSILNREITGSNNNKSPNDAYNGGGYNSDFVMKYIDIDNDKNTFSSSSATLKIPKPACYKIVHAGLYWGAILQQKDRKGIEEVMLKLPKGGYNKITGEIIHDANAAPIGDDKNKAYACYADITDLVAGQADAQGEYTVANVLSSTGSNGGTGLSAGWSIYIVYEDPTLPAKYITSFDGFSGIGGATTLDIPVSGFKTIPTGPVRVKFAFAALEGDQPIEGDYLRINGTTISATNAANNTIRATNNFFNSSVTYVDPATDKTENFLDRKPASKNTLGYDAGILNINNPASAAHPGGIVIDNNATSASIKLGSTQDVYFYYFNAFSVDIIEPKIVLTKIVKNAAGDDIGGKNVVLGQQLNYEIGFRNTGNDDAKSLTIRDVLPINIIFNYPDDLNPLPVGVKVKSYDENTRSIVFEIDESLVKANSSLLEHVISFKVQVVPDCKSLSEACSNSIDNSAYATYKGTLNTDFVISDDPSVNTNTGCILTPKATNFLVGVDGCKYTEDIVLCKDDVDLVAAKGYSKYTWYSDEALTKEIGTGQTLNVKQPGVYYVYNLAAAPCRSIYQAFTVTRFGSSNKNPVIPYAQEPYKGEVLICQNDGKELPNLFLCGAGDSRMIKTNISDGSTITWEKLDLTSCTPPTSEKCANESTSCSWTEVAKGQNYEAKIAGQYRLTLNYKDGCFNRFYFNVFTNDLDATETHKDIICGKAGNITVGSVPEGYEYSIDGKNYQPGNSFDITTAGLYTVYIRLIGVTENTCIFTIPKIQIRERKFDVVEEVTQPLCYGEKGKIKVAVNDANPQYYYKLSSNGAVLYNVGPVPEAEYEFDKLDTNKDYVLEISTSDGCKDTKDIHIGQVWNEFKANLALIEPLTACSDGKVGITTEGGNSPYNYFINSDTVFQTENEFVVTTPGVYEVKIVDKNNCTITTSITVEANPKPVYTIDKSTLKCNNDKGQIFVNVSNPNGYTLEYSINGGTFGPNPTFLNLSAGNYSVVVQYTLSGVTCTDTAQKITIAPPADALTASGGVSELAGCRLSGLGGRLRITNVVGGKAPYQYSFDNGNSWQADPWKDVLHGTYILKVMDDAGCIYTIPYDVILDEKPADPEIKIEDVVYNCNGTGKTTATVINPVNENYTYEYYIDTKPNTPITNNVFDNILSGTHTIKVKYKLVDATTYSNLLKEDFGSGAPTTSPGIAAAYCFNNQDPNIHTCPNPTRSVEDNQYSVASFFWRGDNAWYHFKDHTTNGADPDGRYLLVNIGGAAGLDGVLYSKPIADVIPNQPVKVDLAVANLLNVGVDGGAPIVRFQLVNPLGQVVAEVDTGKIAEDKNDPNRTKWINIPTISLNPGPNTNLTFVIRSGSTVYGGNDLLIDDISVYQLPKSCLAEREFDFEVGTNKAFTVLEPTIENVACSGGSTGTITITAQNFDTTNGFYYSIDNGGIWNTSTTSPVIISGLTAKSYTVIVQSDAAGTCTKSFTKTIGSPTPVIVTASVTAPATCTTQATITADASGGTGPTYKYELRAADGITVVMPFQDSKTFTGPLVVTGSYTVVANDLRGCSSVASAVVSVTDPIPPTAKLADTSDLCFDSVDKATIIVTATGTGTLTYSLDGADAVQTNTFTNVGVGTHNVVVTDSNNCKVTVSNIIVAPVLTAKANVAKTLDCNTTGATIEVDITDGKSAYTYKVKVDSGSYGASFPVTGNTFNYAAAGAGLYTFEISDSNSPTACKAEISATVASISNPTVDAKPTQVKCFGDSTGAVTLEAFGGSLSYTYSFDNSLFTNKVTYTGLKAGISYPFQVTDSNGCTSAIGHITLTQPNKVDGEISATDIKCSATGTTPAVVTIDGKGGVANYTYSFNSNTNFTSVNTFPKSTAGSVTAYVKDGNGCIAGPFSITIGALDQITDIDLKDHGYDCSTTPQGGHVTLTALKVGTLANISYKITAGPAGYNTASNTTGDFQSLAPGLYTFLATDSKTGCTFPINHEIKAASDIVAGGSVVTTIKCNGGTGTIQFTVSGAKANGYDYVIKNGIGLTVQQATAIPATTTTITVAAALVAGDYTITVTDRLTKCQATYKVTLVQPAKPLDVTATAPNVNCNKYTVDITAVGHDGTPSYTYAVIAHGPTAPTVFGPDSKLSVNTINGTILSWDVYVKDANGCTDFVTVDILKDAIPTVTAVLENQCTGSGNKFRIKATGLGGIAPLTYGINGVNGAFTTDDFFDVNASATPYTVWVKDANQCTASATAITVYDQLTATSAVKELDCSLTTPEATITVTPSGGKTPYKYEVSTDGGTIYTSMLSNVYKTATAGTFKIKVTDANLCTFIVTETILAITKPVISIVSQTNVSCNGKADGKVTLTATGGSGGYTYSKYGIIYGSASTFLNLPPGDYDFFVKDSKECTDKIKVTITEPTVLTTTVTAPAFTCSPTNTKQSTTVTIVTPTTGTAPYEYKFNTGSYSATQQTLVVNDNGTDQTIAYSVKDANGCTYDSSVELFKLNPPKIISAVPSAVTCDLPTSTVTVKTTVGTGVGTLAYAITNPVLSPANISGASTGIFTGLAPNKTYTFRVTDANGCYDEIAVPVNPVTNIAIVSNKDNDAKCKGSSTGSGTYTISGIATVGNYDFVLTTGTLGSGTLTKLNNTLSLNNVAQGTYIVKVTDKATGCFNSATIIIGQPVDDVTISATATKINCNKFTATITAVGAGGTPNYKYAVVKKSASAPAPAPAVYDASATLTVDTKNGVDMDWVVYVMDNNGCTNSFPILIDTDPTPTVTATLDNQCTGSGSKFRITATGLGGIAPLKYGINGATGTFKLVNTFDVAASATPYVVWVQDANGCTASATPITVNPQLTAVAKVTKTLSCVTGSTDAEITVDITGGKSTYTYKVDSGSGSIYTVTGTQFIYSAGAAKTYKFEITDSNSPACTVEVSIAVAAISNPTVTIANQVNITCFGANNGSVKLKGNGGSGSGYTFSANAAGPFSPIDTFTGLTPGLHTFYVKDGKECPASIDVTILEPTALTTTANAAPFSCNTTTNAKQSTTVTIVPPTTGTSPYEYSFNGTSYGPVKMLTVNDNGSDQVITFYVRDKNLCVYSNTLTIAKLNPPEIASATPSAVTCKALTSTVTVITKPGTGVGNLVYSITAPAAYVTTNTTGIFAKLDPNITYSFKVVDENGCFDTETVKVNAVTPIVVTPSKLSDVKCNGGTTGIAKYTISGFSATTNYSVAVTTVPALLPHTLTQVGDVITLTNLGKGAYTLSVVDITTGCKSDATVTINEPVDPLTATYLAVNANCKVGTSKVTVTALGGTLPYKYSFVHAGAGIGALTPSASDNLDPAVSNWDVYVVDGNGCQVKLDVAITKDAVPTVTATAAGQCLGNGTYTITASGTGTGTLQYSLDGKSYQLGTTFTVTDAGIYTVWVKDANGCPAQTATPVTVLDQLTISAKLDKNITCVVGSEAAKITLTVGGGAGPFAYTSSPATGTFVGNVFTPSTAGDYIFTVTDTSTLPIADRCTATTIAALKITLPVNPHFTMVEGPKISCNGDQSGSLNITIDKTKGLAPFVINVYNNDAPGKDYGTQTSGLPAGNYTVTITDAKGCSYKEDIEIKQPAPIVVDYDTTPMQCVGAGVSKGEIIIKSVKGGTANYDYYVTGINGYSKEVHGIPGTTVVFEVVDFGLYQIRVVDKNGCSNIISDVLIAAPVDELGVVINTTATCAPGGGSATITIKTVFAGNGPYHFNIYKGKTPAQIWTADGVGGWQGETSPKESIYNGLTPGVTYTFIIYDEDTKCYYYQVAPTPVPTNSKLKVVGEVINNVTCTGSKDGSFTFAIQNNYPVVSPTPPSTVNVSFQVYEALTNLPVSIVPPLTTTTATITDGTTSANINVGPLPVGSYYILVRETSGPNVGCSVVSTNFNIKESPIKVSVTASATSIADCTDLGRISAQAKDGTGPYKYIVLPSPSTKPAANDTAWDTVNTFKKAGSVAGIVYDVYAKDAFNCIVSVPVTVFKYEAPTIVPIIPICYDGKPFKITIVGTVDPAIVGDATYSVDGSTYQDSPEFTFNAPGIYNLFIKDGKGCTATVDYEVKSVLKLDAVLTKDLDCSVTDINSDKAIITLTASGGFGTIAADYKYEYSTDNGISWTLMTPTPQLGGLPTLPDNVLQTKAIENYIFRATDKGNTNPTACQVTKAFVLDPIPAVVFTVVETNITCPGGTDGTITVDVTSGVGPYKYQLEKIGTPIPIVAYQPSNKFTGLAVGNYVVRVRDAKLCFATENATITIPAPLVATAVLTKGLTCASDNSPVDAVITVTVASGGTSPYEYSFDGGTTFIRDNIYTTDVAAPITVIIKDGNDCETTLPVVPVPALNSPTAMKISGTPIYCLPVADQKSTVTINSVTGGVFVPVTSPLLYEILSPIVVAKQTSNVFANLDPSTEAYVFQVTDNNGCTYKDSFKVDPVVSITVSSDLITNVSCEGFNDGAVKFTVANHGTHTYTAVLTTGAGTITPVGDIVTVTDLVAGTYVLQVTDDTTKCTSSATMIVAEPTALTVAPDLNINADCDSDARVSVIASGGTAPYQYSFVVKGFGSGGAYTSDSEVSLNPTTSADWEVWVKDAHNCLISVALPKIVKDPSPTVAMPAPICFEGLPITIDLSIGQTVGTGLGPVVYTVNGATQTTEFYDITAPGFYEISSTDINGCPSNVVTYEVKPQLDLTAKVNRDLSCILGNEDAQFELTASNGHGSYTYSYTLNGGGSISMPGNTLTNGAAGDYVFTVKDAQNCSANYTIKLDPIVPVVFTVKTTAVTCNGSSTGTISVDVTSGVGPYEYQLEDVAGTITAFQDVPQFTGLKAGTTYVVRVIGAKMCEYTATATITEPSALSAISKITTDLVCNAGNNASEAVVTITPSGGTTPYEYSYNNGISFSGDNIFKTSVGIKFDVLVKDKNGCIFTLTDGVDLPALVPPTDLMFSTTAFVTCANNGIVEITGHLGGVGAVQYETVAPSPIIFGKQASTTFANLTPGTYVFKITDANGCTYEESFPVVPVTNITVASELVKNVSCNAGTDGSIKFTVENKAGGYTAILTPNLGTLTQVGDIVTVTGLPAGTYTLDVKDAITDCVDAATIVVGEPVVLGLDLVSQTAANCYLGAVVTVKGKGGSPLYKYAFVQNNVTPTALDFTDSDFAVLDFALNKDWDVYVQDANLICSAKLDVEITEDDAPTIDPNAEVYCYTGGPVAIEIHGTTDPDIVKAPTMYSIGNGYYTDPHFTLNAPGSYEFFIKDGNGCVAKATYVLRQELLIEATLTEDLNCTTNDATITLSASQGTGAGTYAFEYDFNNSGNFNAVPSLPYKPTAAGIYTFRVKDASTCQTVSVPVKVTPLTVPIFTTELVHVRCEGDLNGSITVTGANGVAPYEYSIDGAAFVSTNTFIGLAAGTYAIQVRDAKKCVATAVNVTIKEPVVLTASHNVTPFGCDLANSAKDAEITLIAHDGTGPYSYSFDNGVTFGDVAIHTFNAATTVNYVIVDINGCRATGSANVPAYNPPTHFDLSATPIYCNNLAGTATVTVSNITGGEPGYTYAIIEPTASATSNTIGSFANLLPGTYVVKVKDANGCSTLNSIEVKKSSEISVEGQLITNVSCKGDATGSIAFTISNYITPANYTFLLSPNNGTFTQSGDVVTYTGLTAANYTFTVHDITSGCTDNVSNFVVNEPVAPLNFTMSASNITCINKMATITVSVTGGTPVYSYAAVPATSPAPTTFVTDDNKISVDTNNGTIMAWDVYVKDLNGCSALFQTQNISTDPLPSAITANVTSECPSATGTYEIVVSATGKAPLQYNIGTGFQSNPVFQVNSSGSYDVTVKDGNGCTVTVTAAVTIKGALDLQLDVQALPSCDFPDGRIVAKTTGGSGNYKYSSGAYIPVVVGTTVTFNNMAAGTHIIKVLDLTTGCSDNVKVDLPAATQITGLALQKEDVTCNGGSNGLIIVKLAPNAPGVNDNPIYKYTLTGTAIGNVLVSVGPQDSNVFNNLLPGDYTVKVTSGRGCNFQVDTRIIQPTPIVVNTPLIAQFNCTSGTNTTNFASITVNSVTGGTNPYVLYEFTKGTTIVQTSTSNVYNETDLAGGSYSVRVFDSKGCVGSSTAPIIINPFITMDKISVAVIAPITCIVNETIQVSVATTGGTPAGLVYTLTGANGTVFNQTNPTGLFSGLAIGNYAITVFNPTTGCTIKDFHYVFDANNFAIEVTPVVDEVCFGAADGIVDLTFVDKQLPNNAGAFTYTITGGPVPITGSSLTAGPVRISGLQAGQYSITAKLDNSPECTVTNAFVIKQPTAQLILEKSQTAITCIAGNNDGTITVSASGGWGVSYQYELNGPVHVDYSTQNEFIGLTAGTYIINAKDYKGCIATTTVVLVNPDPIVINATPNATVLSCYGDKNGIITVSPPTGGQGSNYMYTLNILSTTPVISSGPQRDPVFTGLGAGTYSITVTDGFSCEKTSANVVIEDPTEIKPNLVLASSQTCDFQSTLTLSAVGGTPPYTYSTDKTFATSNGFTSSVTFPVAVGKYQYYVKDANSCVATISNEIKIDALEPLTLDLDITNAVVNCLDEATGVIVADAKGGLGNYVYSLETTAGTPILSGQPGGRFEDLVAGTYVVRVVSNDCDAVLKTIEIKQPLTAIEATFTPTNVSCFGEKNGKIVVTATGGTGTIKYAISPDLDQFDFTNTFEKLAPGKYTVIAQDQKGCFVLTEVEITQPNPLLLAEVANSMIPEACAGDKDGAFSIEIKGGTAPYSVSLDDKKGTYTLGTSTQTIFDFVNLSGGLHTVYVKDAQGCTFEFVENMPLPVVLDPIATVTYECVDNSAANRVIVTVDESNTNLADIDYALDGSATYQESNIFTNVAPGNHFITARHTNGCEIPTASFEIIAVQPLGLILSEEKGVWNIVTATATGGSGNYEYSIDGVNFSSSNKFTIYKTDTYTITVRDKNGCTLSKDIYVEYVDVCIPNYFTPNGDGVYDTWAPGCTNIYNNLVFSIFDRYGRIIVKYHYGQKWDGRYNGEELPSGDYWYVLKLNDEKDAREFVGHFTLYR